MNRTYAHQKAALTQALKSPEGERKERVIREVVRVIEEWNSPEWSARHGVPQGSWPDDWTRWQRALSDVGEYRPMEELV